MLLSLFNSQPGSFRPVMAVEWEEPKHLGKRLAAQFSLVTTPAPISGPAGSGLAEACSIGF